MNTLQFLHLVLYLTLLVQVARALTGLELQEVAIVDPSTLDGSQDEIICSLSSIELQNSDNVFRKYLITPEQNDYIVVDWVKDNTAVDIETCATNALNLQARMFLFNEEGECFTSARKRYERLEEPCPEDQTKLVYMDDTADMADDCSDGLQIMAAGEVTVKKQVYCEIQWVETCDSGNISQSLETITGHSCHPTTDVRSHHIYLSGVFFSPRAHNVHRGAAYHCILKGAAICAPQTENKQQQYIKDLLEFNAQTARPNTIVGLASKSAFGEFEWDTGVTMSTLAPQDWASVPSSPYTNAPCVYINSDNKFYADACVKPGTISDICCFRSL